MIQYSLDFLTGEEMNKLFIFLLFILIFMAVTKPEKDDFNYYLKEKYFREMTDSFCGSMINGIKVLAIRTTAIYEDKILFSIVKTGLYKKELIFIGILGHWFCINHEDETHNTMNLLMKQGL